ncbi:haloacid dehalogenase type II [Proteobacteria bacterium 005FR1]|nr:haloacid dehalogenase type II [Proteobacteria bacterium 005FR1]
MSLNLVFDVNETLLDTAALDPLFEHLFGQSDARKEWFLTMEECWLTDTIVDRFQPFSEQAGAALKMVGQRRGIEVQDKDCNELTGEMIRLPPHQDVHETLELLKSDGARLTALTNGSFKSVQQQLQSASLSGYFDEVIAADQIQRYKPAAKPYLTAAEHAGVPTGQLWMIAAHAWDITGAASAGCRTAFVKRPGKVPNPIGPTPDLIGSDLREIREKLLAQAR